MSRQLIFGAGPAGRAIAQSLVSSGVETVEVASRSGVAGPGWETVKCDVLRPGEASRTAEGADVIYFALNPPHYQHWDTEFPALLHPVLDAARGTGARLVALDNFYCLPADGSPLTETTASRPHGSKGRTRARMTEQLLATNDIDVAVGRASDFYGPGVTQSALGDFVFGAALSNKRIHILGDPTQRHTYTFVPDVGAGLAALGTATQPAHGLWNLPAAPAVTTAEMIEMIWQETGTRTRKLLAAGPVALKAFGLLKPAMREYLETLPQFQHSWVVDDAKFRAAFPTVIPTELRTAVQQTVDWYRNC